MSSNEQPSSEQTAGSLQEKLEGDKLAGDHEREEGLELANQPHIWRQFNGAIDAILGLKMALEADPLAACERTEIEEALNWIIDMKSEWLATGRRG